jgi:hypothetical protein
MTMQRSDNSELPRAGSLRASVADDEAALAPARRPGSNVFNRMRRPEPVPAPPPGPAAPVKIPMVRRRWRPSGLVFPVLVAMTGIGAGYVLLEATKSTPMAILCGCVGVVGAVFCHTLLRDRVEIR